MQAESKAFESGTAQVSSRDVHGRSGRFAMGDDVSRVDDGNSLSIDRDSEGRISNGNQWNTSDAEANTFSPTPSQAENASIDKVSAAFFFLS